MSKKTMADNGTPLPAPPRPLETLSERVAYLIDLRNMSRQGLEEEARLSRGYVSRVIKGERLKLSPELLRRMADALQVSYEWLATGRGDLNDLSSVPFSALAGSPGSPGSPAQPARRPKTFNLEAAIAYHREKWSAPALAAARAMAAGPDAEELEPPEWAEVLDQVEVALSKVRLRKRA